MGEKSLDIYKDVISNIYTSYIYNDYDYLMHITRDFSPILFIIYMYIYLLPIYFPSWLLILLGNDGIKG